MPHPGAQAQRPWGPAVHPEGTRLVLHRAAPQRRGACELLVEEKQDGAFQDPLKWNKIALKNKTKPTLRVLWQKLAQRTLLRTGEPGLGGHARALPPASCRTLRSLHVAVTWTGV